MQYTENVKIFYARPSQSSSAGTLGVVVWRLRVDKECCDRRVYETTISRALAFVSEQALIDLEYVMRWLQAFESVGESRLDGEIVVWEVETVANAPVRRVQRSSSWTKVWHDWYG